MNTLQIKLTIVGILTVFSAYSIKRVSWSQKTNFGSNSKSQSFSISNSHSHNPEEDRSTDSIQGTGRKLGPSDWVNDLPTNYSLLNQTCPYKPKSALNSALLMAFVGFGLEYWYLGFYSAFQYKAAFFLFTLILTIWIRLIPIPKGGDSFFTLFGTSIACMASFTCWTWQVSNFLDMYYGRAVDACTRVPDPIWSFMKIYYWRKEVVEISSNILLNNTNTTITNATNITNSSV